jgi:predicted transglutaminase-like cysteine proteinase
MTPIARFLTALFLVTAYLCAPTSLFSQTKKPKPVKQLPPAATKVQPSAESEQKTFGLEVERYITNIAVEKDGTSVQTLEVLKRARSEGAVALLTKLERVFNRDLEEVEVSDAYILKADGRKLVLPASAIQIRLTPQSEAAPAFSSLMQVEIGFKGLAIGDASHYRLRLKTKRTHFAGHFDHMELLPGIFEWKSAEVNLSVPVDYPVYIQAVGLDGGRLADEAGRARWQWTKKDHKAIKLEPIMDNVISASPRVMMTSFKNFEALGDAYWKEASTRAIVTPEIRAKAEEISRGLTGEEQQAAAIYQWVNKNIRYLAVVIDRNGWIPHDAGEILANRYGDCKDYTTILHAMLKARGIESHPVIIRADTDNWFPEVATPAFFNHAILYIPSLKLFADATAPNTRLGLLPQPIVGKKAFLAGEKTAVIETPADQPDESQILSHIALDLKENGDVTARSVNRYVGRSELLMRPLFTGLTPGPSMLIRTVLAYMGQTGQGKILKIGDPYKVADPLEVEMEVELPGYTTLTPSGSFRIPLALNLNNILAMADYVKPESRQSPLALGALRIRETFVVTFPEGVELSKDSTSDTGLTNATGSYKHAFKVTGRSVEMTREIVVQKDLIAPDEYAKVRELLLKATESFQREIRYSAPSKFLADASRSVAKRPRPAANPLAGIFVEEIARFKGISAVEARRLESQLQKDPSNADAHVKLANFYSNPSARDTKARSSARTKHRLWLIENRPEIGDDEIVGFSFSSYKADSPDYAQLKTAWLKQIEANKANSRIRLNAFTFLRKNDGALAGTIIEEGIRLDPANFVLPLAAYKVYETWPEGVATETPEQRIARKKHAFKFGESALTLLKLERSDDRDTERRQLLHILAKGAFELKDYDKAKALATELVLDFGQDSTAWGYDNAAHIGNIILGRVELQRKNTAKAKEHLLIAIRAPLRKADSWLEDIDTILAKELFEAGEKEAVIEYFRLCEGLSNLTTEKKLFEDQSKALKLWQFQIRQGKTPTFDFYKL